MEWLQTPPAQPKVACGVRVCWDMEDKDPYPDPCGGASRILCKRTDVVQIEQIISRERSRVQGDRSLGVILAVEMPRVKDQPLNPASCRKRKLRVERGSRSSPGVCRSISL